MRDVFYLSITAFGGPQAHMAMFLDLLVNKRGYLTESELIELHALCQILPGPTSTQTITAIGFRIGKANLAYLTLLIWMLPAITLMTSAALVISTLNRNNIDLSFTRFIQPMAVAFVAHAAVKISQKVVTTSEGVALMIVSAFLAYHIKSPFLFPVILILSGLATSRKYKALEQEDKAGIKISWSNFVLWAIVFIGAASLGGLTQSLPVRLFENFYRNGSLIFGGGQVLIPLLYTEFVEFKAYLSGTEFLSGYALVQSIPGPVFSFSSYIGALSMKSFGIGGEIIGALVAALGIFLPGTFLIFFVIRFWNELKKYRVVKASIEGINAASSGMVIAAAFLMFKPLDDSAINYILMIITFALLYFTKIPSPAIIAVGLIAGFVL
ncbi:MAG: chromate efflux transporter [Bacteroidota bacterium]